MRPIILFIIVLIFFLPASLSADDTYFPDNIFSPERPDIHKFVSDWYCKHLKALEEPSIYQLKSKEYITIIRFTWLRSFDNPISLRLEIDNEGLGTLYIKMSNGAGGYEPGEIIRKEKKEIKKQTVSAIVSSVENANFWSLPSRVETSGLDGSHWIIEFLSNGRYHLVDRWSPESGPIRELGLTFIELSGLKVKAIY